MKKLLCSTFAFFIVCTSCASPRFLGKPVTLIFPTILKDNRPIAVHVIQNSDGNIYVWRVPGDINVAGTVVEGLAIGLLGLLLTGPVRNSDAPDKKKIADIGTLLEQSSSDFLLETLKEQMKFPASEKITYDILDLKNGQVDYGDNSYVHVNFKVNHLILGLKHEWSDQVTLVTEFIVFVITDQNTQRRFIESLVQNKGWLRCDENLLSNQYLSIVKTSPPINIDKRDLLYSDGQLLKNKIQLATRVAIENFMGSWKSQTDENIIPYGCIQSFQEQVIKAGAQ